MKYFQLYSPLFVAAALLALLSCNDPTLIGSELLSGEELDVEFTDTITFRTYSAKTDSVILFENTDDAFRSFTNFPFGNFNDPIFGLTSSTINSQVSLNVTLPGFEDSFVVDSIVLILPYQSDNFYGDNNEMYSIEVWELGGDFGDSTIYHSGQDYEEGMNGMIGSIDVIPNPDDSITIFVPKDNEEAKLIPQLRIPLSEAFEDILFVDDTTKYGSITDFLDFFPGFQVRPTTTNRGMLNFDMRSSEAGIKVYYQNDTSGFEEYLFPIFSTRVVTARYDHEYTGSIAEQFLGENAVVSDSLLFVQGMSGTNIIVEFPHIESLGDIIINQAILEFPILELMEDDPSLYNPVDQLIIHEIREDGSRGLIIDADFARGSQFALIFGGIPEDGMYKMNISGYIQDAMRGLVNNKIEINVSLKPEVAQRAVLAGPGNSDSPAKLNVTFTNY